MSAGSVAIRLPLVQSLLATWDEVEDQLAPEPTD